MPCSLSNGKTRNSGNTGEKKSARMRRIQTDLTCECLKHGNQCIDMGNITGFSPLELQDSALIQL